MSRPALLVVLALCVVTAGCSVLGPNPTREARAVSAVDNATAAVTAANTYQYETDVTVVASADDRTERVDVQGTGAVDLGAREMRSNATFQGETRRSYTLNRTAYRECGEPWDGWGVEELEADGDWRTQTPVHRQLSLLEAGSLYYNGTTTVDGEKAVLVTGEPTADAITQYRERRSRSLFGGPSVENAEVRVWLDPETDRPLKTDVRFEARGDGGSATARLPTTFGGYGDPVSVTHYALSAEDTYELGCPGE